LMPRVITIADKVYESLYRLKRMLGCSWSELLEMLLGSSTIVWRVERVPTCGIKIRCHELRGTAGTSVLTVGWLRDVPPVPCDPCYTMTASYGLHRATVKVARSGRRLIVFGYAYLSVGPPDPDMAAVLLRACIQKAAELYGLGKVFRVELTDETKGLLPLLSRAREPHLLDRLSTQPSTPSANGKDE